MYANFSEVIVPGAPQPTAPTPDPTPTHDPDPTPTSLNCYYCSRQFISSRNIRGVVVRARNPNTSYYVTDFAVNIFRRDDDLIYSDWIRAANDQEINLALTRIYCFNCTQPAGWKVLQRNQAHPIVNTGHFLLPVSPPPRPRPRPHPHPHPAPAPPAPPPPPTWA